MAVQALIRLVWPINGRTGLTGLIKVLTGLTGLINGLTACISSINGLTACISSIISTRVLRLVVLRVLRLVVLGVLRLEACKAFVRDGPLQRDIPCPGQFPSGN